MKLIKFKKRKGCTIDCTIDLNQLFEPFKTKNEIKKFNAKWKDFIASDPDNKKVYKIYKINIKSPWEEQYNQRESLRQDNNRAFLTGWLMYDRGCGIP